MNSYNPFYIVLFFRLVRLNKLHAIINHNFQLAASLLESEKPLASYAIRLKQNANCLFLGYNIAIFLLIIILVVRDIVILLDSF